MPLFRLNPRPIALLFTQVEMTDDERREEKLRAFTERQQQRQAEIEKRRAQRLDGADPSEDAQAFFDAFKSRRAEIQVTSHCIARC